MTQRLEDKKEEEKERRSRGSREGRGTGTRREETGKKLQTG